MFFMAWTQESFILPFHLSFIITFTSQPARPLRQILIYRNKNYTFIFRLAKLHQADGLFCDLCTCVHEAVWQQMCRDPQPHLWGLCPHTQRGATGLPHALHRELLGQSEDLLPIQVWRELLVRRQQYEKPSQLPRMHLLYKLCF